MCFRSQEKDRVVGSDTNGDKGASKELIGRGVCGNCTANCRGSALSPQSPSKEHIINLVGWRLGRGLKAD